MVVLVLLVVLEVVVVMTVLLVELVIREQTGTQTMVLVVEAERGPSGLWLAAGCGSLRARCSGWPS